MDYSDIASVSGKGGLFKIVKPTRTGVILESLDAKKSKLVANATQRVSVLSDISIYTTDQEGSIPLGEVFLKIKDEFEDETGVTATSDPEELKAFIKHIIPNYDPSRVYVSDIKKVVNWYSAIFINAPELLTAQAAEDGEQEKEDSEN